MVLRYHFLPFTLTKIQEQLNNTLWEDAVGCKITKPSRKELDYIQPNTKHLLFDPPILLLGTCPEDTSPQI